jgi:hypothetical protein
VRFHSETQGLILANCGLLKSKLQVHIGPEEQRRGTMTEHDEQYRSRAQFPEPSRISERAFPCHTVNFVRSDYSRDDLPRGCSIDHKVPRLRCRNTLQLSSVLSDT